VVAVLVTPGTAKGERLARLHERFAEGARVFTLPMPGLADLVESGEVDGPRVEALLEAALEEPVREGIDALALGCTHYAFLRPVLARMLPPSVRIIDASAPVARRVVDVLTAGGVDLAGDEPAEVLCYATGDPGDLEAKIARLRAAGADLPPLRVARPVG
jgi:glutamate racemase